MGSFYKLLVVFLSLFFLSPLLAQENPINITSQSMMLEKNKNMVVFEGDVKAVKDDMTINSDKLIVYYGKGREIEKMKAMGMVRIEKDDGMATADVADFFNKEEKLILTGEPRFTQGPNSVEGEKITIYLNNGKVLVEGGNKRKVNARFIPEEKNGNKR